MTRQTRHAPAGDIRPADGAEDPMLKLSRWVAHLETTSAGEGPAKEMSVLLEELQISYEELRVAEEELLRQHEELLQSQHVLEAERLRYQELFNLAPDGYIVTDAYGTIRELNLAAIQMIGIKYDHLLGKPLISFILGNDRSDFRRFLRDVLAGRAREWRTHVAPRSGILIPVAITVSLGAAHDEAPVLRWSLRDITDRLDAERELYESNQMLQALVQSSPLAVLVLGSDDCVTLWNPAAEKMFGWTAAEILDHPLPNVPEEKRQEFAKQRSQAKRGVQHEDVETQRLTKDGRLLDVAIWTSPLKTLGGHINSVLTIVVDITERRRSEEVRRQLHQRILTAQEEERRRISRELHDHLGQQLTAILLGLKSLKDEGNQYGGSERRRTSEKIDRIYELVDNVMRESHHLAWELRPTALDDLGLEVALQRYLYEWADNAGVKVDFQSIGFQNDRLSTDLETALYRVAQEALTNVARHARATVVSVTLECSRNHATLVVEDNGTGFDVAGKEATHRLGLTGMRERLVLVNGSLEIESELDRGTSLFARAPRKT